MRFCIKKSSKTKNPTCLYRKDFKDVSMVLLIIPVVATAAAAAVIATFFIATAATAALLFGLRFVDNDLTAHNFRVIQVGDGLLSLAIVFHLDKPEALAATGD